MKFDIKQERDKLDYYIFLDHRAIPVQRKLVSALEQLEQAREALVYADNALRVARHSSLRVTNALEALNQQETTSDE